SRPHHEAVPCPPRRTGGKLICQHGRAWRVLPLPPNGTDDFLGSIVRSMLSAPVRSRAGLLLMRLALVACLLPALGGLGTGCGGSSATDSGIEATEPPWFVEITQEVGLDFVHEVGSRPLEDYFMP